MNNKQPKQQTAVEWLVENLRKGEFIFSANELIEQAKKMEKEQIENTSPQIISNCVIKEISDEEIDKQAELIELGIHRMFFKTGAKWYREQLKKRQ